MQSKNQSSPSEKLSKLDQLKERLRSCSDRLVPKIVQKIEDLFSYLRNESKISLCVAWVVLVVLLLWVVYGKWGYWTDLMLGVIQIVGGGGLTIILYLYNESLRKQELFEGEILADKRSQLQPQTSETTETELVVFIDAINSDDVTVQEIMKSLKENKFIYLEPVKISSFATFHKELTVSVELSKAIILIYDTPTIPINWVYERLRLYKKSLPVARINNIAIFAKNETCQQLLEGKKKSFPIIPQVISHTEEVITFLKDIQSPRTKQ